MTVGRGIRTFKPNPEELEVLRSAAVTLKEANAATAEAKKQVKATKTALTTWLKDGRDLDLNALPVGSLVVIEGVATIEIGEQQRLDSEALLVGDPLVYAEYNRGCRVERFKPLV